MGLYINHLKSVTFEADRTLYIYLLDYGWPDGNWEQIFKRHFMKMAGLASDSGAAVIGSPGGIHFANEVLSWHKVGELDPDKVLPGLLITKTPPDRFIENQFGGGDDAASPTQEMLVIALRPICNDEDDFVKLVEGIFSDLNSGTILQDFQVAEHDLLKQKKRSLTSRMGNAIELKPGAFGFKLDLKELFSNRR